MANSSNESDFQLLNPGNPDEEGWKMLYFLRKQSGSLADFIQSQTQIFPVGRHQTGLVRKQSGEVLVALEMRSWHSKPHFEPVFARLDFRDSCNISDLAQIQQVLNQELQAWGQKEAVFFTQDEEIFDLLQKTGAKKVNTLEFFELEKQNFSRPERLAELPEGWQLCWKHELHAGDLPELAKFYTQLANRIQREDYSWRAEKTAEWLDFKLKSWAQQGKIPAWFCLKDEKGDWAGFSLLIRDQANPEQVEQSMTGIEERYARKGLGKMLKTRALDDLFAGLVFAGAAPKRVQTSCLVGNLPIRKLNERLGFQKVGEPEWELFYSCPEHP